MSTVVIQRTEVESVHDKPFHGLVGSNSMSTFRPTSSAVAPFPSLDKTRVDRISQQDAMTSISTWRKHVNDAPKLGESTREKDRDALTTLSTNTLPTISRSTIPLKQSLRPPTCTSIPKPATVPDVFEAGPIGPERTSTVKSAVLATTHQSGKRTRDGASHRGVVKKVKADQQSSEELWRQKWVKIFPTLIFYFDVGTEGPGKVYQARVKAMGAKVDAFFSQRVTHLIAKSSTTEKKSMPPPQPRKTALRESPQNPFLDGMGVTDLPSKAEALGMKVWTVDKLLNMLNLLAPVEQLAQPNSLHNLLQEERIHGTRERDATAPRPDHYYFKPGSKYLLIEDAVGRSRPIMMKECSTIKDGPDWPVLYERFLRPSAANQCTIDPSKVRERAWTLYVERKPFEGEQPPNTELKRSTSLRSLPPTPKLPEAVPYQNASGNSVVLTSNIASTSAANQSPATYGQNAMGMYKDRALMQMNKRVQVLKGNARLAAAKRDSATEASIAELTSRRASTGSTQSSGPVVPPKTFLSRFQLTSMLEQARMPIREKEVSFEVRVSNRQKVDAGLRGREQETAAGYCENCRIRYNDLSAHIQSKKHRRFATDPDNFESLDRLLISLARPPNPKLCVPDFPPCTWEHAKDEDCDLCAAWSERGDEFAPDQFDEEGGSETAESQETEQLEERFLSQQSGSQGSNESDDT